MEPTEKQSESTTEIVEPPKKNGGSRIGAGRPKGSINKISGQAILEAFENTLGIPFEIQLALNYQQALYGEDKYLLNKYDTLILNKVVSDKVDITTNGQSLNVQLTFPTRELPDYIDITPNEPN